MSLSVQGLRGGYGRLEVLHGIDVEVPAGRLVTLLGANGAGKTTLLRVLSGLLPVGAGSVVLEGKDVTGTSTERLAALGLVHVPENRLVFPTLTVADNLALGGYARRRAPAAELSGARERVLALFPRLQDRLGQVAGTLSGGEQQMLAIGRGLMSGPRVLLLDEPSVGLAPRLVGEIFAALARLRDEGLALLLIEQNARAAFGVADLACVMERGRLVMRGVPSELATDPRVQAAYLGGGFAAAGDGAARP